MISAVAPQNHNEGRSYLVTGACGGVGAAVTDMLASRGATVFAADSRQDNTTLGSPRRGWTPFCGDSSGGKRAEEESRHRTFRTGAEGVRKPLS